MRVDDVKKPGLSWLAVEPLGQAIECVTPEKSGPAHSAGPEKGKREKYKGNPA